MNRARRLISYVSSMFPVRSHLPQALALFAGVYFPLQAMAGFVPLRFGPVAILGAASVATALLLVRLYDDVRDAPSDLRLARAGDPRYVGRPTVTGLVSIAEVRSLVVALSLAVCALNLIWGGPMIRLAVVAGFATTWLAFRWFFLPGLADRLGPFATLARKSLTIVIAVYVVAVHVDETSRIQLSRWAWPLVLAPCFEAAAWEVSRKIRAPGDETDYWTYSKVLGPRGAAALIVGFVSLALLCLMPVARTVGAGWAYSVALLGAALVVVAASGRFMLRPTRERASLRPYAELFGAVANGGLAAALCLSRGVVFR